MSRIDYSARQIETKVLYWGPRDSGKFENLRHIWDRTKANPSEAMTKSANVLGLPMSLGTIREFKTNMLLVRVPHAFPEPARVFHEMGGAGVDGVVFVADSANGASAANRESLSTLIDLLAQEGFAWRKIPSVVQVNKRDVAGAMPLDRMIEDLGAQGMDVVEGVARAGLGVFDTLKVVTRLVLGELRKA